MALKPARWQWSDDGILKSLDYGDIYFQPGLGPAESDYVFIQRNNLPKRFLEAADTFSIAELGFGSGLNFLLTADLFMRTAPKDARLYYVSIEKHPIPRDVLSKIYRQWKPLQKISRPVIAQYPPMIEGFHHIHFDNARIHLMLLWGDVADVLPELSGLFDAWYLDGFAPAKNPAMWDDKLFPLIAERTKPGGTLATFSSAGSVRRALAGVGFTVEKTKGFGKKRDMTVARLDTKMTAAETSQRRKASVIGAGLAGAAAARALADKGFTVTVFDRQPVCAGETSGNPFGVLYPKLTVDPSPHRTFHQHAFCYTRNLVEHLELPSWIPCGVEHLDTDNETKERHKNLVARNDYPKDFISYGRGRLSQPTAGYLSPRELCESLLSHPNIKRRFNKSLDDLNDAGSGHIILASGVFCKNFAEAEHLPLQSLRGQISLVRSNAASRKIKRVVCHDGYILPEEKGVHIIGATFSREAPTSYAVREKDHIENLDKLATYMPGLKLGPAALTGGRVGYRAATPDKLPVAGPLSPATGDKIYVATGFGAHGISGAPLAGAVIASLITGDPLPVPKSLLRYLLPDRFVKKKK